MMIPDRGVHREKVQMLQRDREVETLKTYKLQLPVEMMLPLKLMHICLHLQKTRT